MDEKPEYKSLISELGVEVLQCEEGLKKLKSFSPSASNYYIVNAMLTAVGPPAGGCNLTEYAVHKRPPPVKADTCFVHCGEENCPASLSFLAQNKVIMKQNCGSIAYLQGGARCFLENAVPLADADACAGFVLPHDPKELNALVKDMAIKEVTCDEAPMTISQLKNAHFINAMISVFGDKADSCSLAGKSVSSHAPAKHHDDCVVFCGEAPCPFAITFLSKAKTALTANCKNIHFIPGGARCFLEKHVPVKNELQCRSLVIG